MKERMSSNFIGMRKKAVEYFLHFVWMIIRKGKRLKLGGTFLSLVCQKPMVEISVLSWVFYSILQS